MAKVVVTAQEAVEGSRSNMRVDLYKKHVSGFADSTAILCYHVWGAGVLGIRGR